MESIDKQPRVSELRLSPVKKRNLHVYANYF
jgi:hypothetical protein